MPDERDLSNKRRSYLLHPKPFPFPLPFPSYESSLDELGRRDALERLRKDARAEVGEAAEDRAAEEARKHGLDGGEAPAPADAPPISAANIPPTLPSFIAS